METKLANDCNRETTTATVQQLPPPPVLIYRSPTSMIFKPTPFNSMDKEEIYCYRFFMKNASGNNVKVRLSDEHITGTGIEVK